MNLTIKKILAVLGFVAVAILAVTRAGADTVQDQQMSERGDGPTGTQLGFASGCSQTGKAYGYVNANRDFWITLSQGSLLTGTNWCEDQDCKLVEGLEYDTGSQLQLLFSPSYKLSYANPTALLMTPGAMWQEPYGYGSLCGGPGVECAGEWPGDWCVGYENLAASESGIAMAKDWLESGYSTPLTFYAGKFRRGVQQGDTCTGSDHGCTWFSITMPAKLGTQTGYIKWEGFYEITTGSSHPNCCNRECCQLVKPAGPGTPVVESPWGRVKGLWR